MSHLSLVQRAIARKQRLTEAQMVHLRHRSYRGVESLASKPTHKAIKPCVLSYRGVTYSR